MDKQTLFTGGHGLEGIKLGVVGYHIEEYSVSGMQLYIIPSNYYDTHQKDLP